MVSDLFSRVDFEGEPIRAAGSNVRADPRPAGRIRPALRPTRPDQRVDLVDDQHDVLVLLHLPQDVAQPGPAATGSGRGGVDDDDGPDRARPESRSGCPGFECWVNPGPAQPRISAHRRTAPPTVRWIRYTPPRVFSHSWRSLQLHFGNHRPPGWLKLGAGARRRRLPARHHRVTAPKEKRPYGVRGRGTPCSLIPTHCFQTSRPVLKRAWGVAIPTRPPP